MTQTVKALLPTTLSYQNWQKGRRYYGVWYITIDNERLIHYCRYVRSVFGLLLYPNYQRQFHITLFVNGFIRPQCYYQDDCSPITVARQVRLLQKLALPKFSLTTTGVASFLANPYVAVGLADELLLIKETLACVHAEIAPSEYCPHITLGMYCQQVAFDDVAQLLVLLNHVHVPQTIRIEKLTFGVYDAYQLQGKLTHCHTVMLG